MSNSVRPRRRQPTRLPRPWDSPGKNTGVGCHVLLQCMKVKSESEVAQLCPILSNSMDCSPPGSSVHGILQARILEWVAISSSRGSSQPRDQTCVSCIKGGFLTEPSIYLSSILHVCHLPSIYYAFHLLSISPSLYHLLIIYHLSIHYPSIYLLSTYHFFTYYLSIICVCLSIHLSMYLSIHIYLLSSVQFSHSVMSDSLNRGMPGLPVHHQLKAFIQTHVHQVVMPSNHLIVCRPLLLLPSIFPSIRVFSSESVLHIWWPKYRSFSLSISPSNEYSGLISFHMDWLDLLAIQGTLKSLLQHHSSK